jgi:hypothetical protein
MAEDLEFERWLEGRRQSLKHGPTAEDFGLPAGLKVESSPEAIRFRGKAEAIGRLRGEFDKLERSPAGSEVHVAGWIFRVEDTYLPDPADNVIRMPWHAWGIAGSVLSDAAYGYESNPLDFSQVGYIVDIAEDGTRTPWPRPDIGVIVEGPLIDDWPPPRPPRADA